MATDLTRIGEKARKEAGLVFTSLYHHICDGDNLRACYDALEADKATGVEEARRCLHCATVCIKGATIPDVMYHPHRLIYPLKRTRERGEGKWKRISWDEALDTIAGKLKAVKEKYGPEAIHVSCGSGQKHIGIQATKIAERLWPTPNTHLGRYTCIHPDVMANSVTFGDTITYEFGPDYGDAKCIVFWGSEPDVATPAQARVVHRALRQGSKLMVIDPRPIPMAKRADLWLRIRPGTDMALAFRRKSGEPDSPRRWMTLKNTASGNYGKKIRIFWEGF